MSKGSARLTIYAIDASWLISAALHAWRDWLRRSVRGAASARGTYVLERNCPIDGLQ